jgi:hypothetical protein
MRSPVAAFALAFAVACSGYAFAADQSPQPLTRADCETAGMNWNDRANVCGSNAAAPAPAAKDYQAPQDAQGESQSHCQSRRPQIRRGILGPVANPANGRAASENFGLVR